MCNSLIWGLVALDGGTVGEKGEWTWLARELSEAAVELGMLEGQCLLLASLRSTSLRFSTAAVRKKLTFILIIINSAFYTFTLLGVFGEFLRQMLLLH